MKERRLYKNRCKAARVTDWTGGKVEYFVTGSRTRKYTEWVCEDVLGDVKYTVFTADMKDTRVSVIDDKPIFYK